MTVGFKTEFRTIDQTTHTVYTDSVQSLRLVEGGLIAQRSVVASSITHYLRRGESYELWQQPYKLN